MPTFRSLGLLLIYYLAFALFYAITLAMNSGDLANLSWRILYMDYPLKALYTLPVWYLIFRLLKDHSLWIRIGLTILLMPVWVKGWQWTYYYISDNFTDGWHLTGNGEWWDVYIPGLFYCIQFGTFFAVEYYHSFIAALRAKAESEKLVLAGELGALKAQLNPHFLYNAFNTISASVPPREEQTRELIGHLSDMFRYQLKAGKKDVIPLSEEIEFVQDYLTLEKARFGDRLRIEIDLPADLASVEVPPLILQPLVENAVKHGVAPLIEGGTVRLTAKALSNDLLELSVWDDGKGFRAVDSSATTGNGVGLKNISRRLDLLYGVPLHIESSAAQGTRVTIKIPLTYVA